MVQIVSLEPTESSASMLGKAFATGLSKNFEKPEQIVQRNLLQAAMNKAGMIAKDPNASPIDITTEFMKAGAGIPGFEKYAGVMLPQILSMSAYQNKLNGGGEGEGGGGQSIQPQQPTQQDQPPGAPQVNPQQQVNPQNQLPGIQLGNSIPLDMGSYIGPKEARKIIQDVGSKGGDANLVKGLINDYNKGTITYNELLNSNVDRKTAQAERQLAMEKKAKTFIDQQLSDQIPEERKNIYYNMLKNELPNHPDLTSAYQKVTKDIQAFEKQVQEIPSKIPEADAYGMPEARQKILRQITKNIMDTDPLAYPILEQMFTDKGHPITEVAEALRPLPDNIKAITKEAEDFRDVMYPKFPMSEGAMMNMIEVSQKDQAKQSKTLSKKMASKWNDDISLINIYTDLKSKAWFPQQIMSLFDDLESNGVKFSGQQQAEKTQLGVTPKITVRRLLK